MEMPLASGPLTSSIRRRPIFRTTRSPGMLTTAPARCWGPWPAGHQSGGSETSTESATRPPSTGETATAAVAVSPPKVKVTGTVAVSRAASSTSAVTVTRPSSPWAWRMTACSIRAASKRRSRGSA